MRYSILLLLAAVAAACGPTPAPPEATDTAEPIATAPAAFPARSTLVDLTHPFDEDTIYWPTDTQGFVLETVSQGMTEGGYYYEAHRFSSAEHGGTHLDAPVHFAEGAWSVEEIPLDRLVGPAVVVGVEEAAAADRDYLVTVEDFRRWEAEHGPIPRGGIVLVRTGYGRQWPDRTAYLGTDLTGPEAVPHLHFPGLHPDAARWLVEERAIHVFGLDTPSLDRGQSTGFESHRVLGAANVPGLENVAHLDRLPPRGFTVAALPMKIADGSGGPVRIVAFLDGEVERD